MDIKLNAFIKVWLPKWIFLIDFYINAGAKNYCIIAFWSFSRDSIQFKWKILCEACCLISLLSCVFPFYCTKYSKYLANVFLQWRDVSERNIDYLCAMWNKLVKLYITYTYTHTHKRGIKLRQFRMHTENVCF